MKLKLAFPLIPEMSSKGNSQISSSLEMTNKESFNHVDPSTTAYHAKLSPLTIACGKITSATQRTSLLCNGTISSNPAMTPMPTASRTQSMRLSTR